MADVSTRGFAIIVLSILLLISPGGWPFVLMVILALAAVGWTFRGVAEELGRLSSEIGELRREIRALERKLEKTE
ncbi:MAG: hypothetical protein J7L37_00950 [Thermococcus sp.]|nr:hypothetical protein [Thermococcus sp.]